MVGLAGRPSLQYAERMIEREAGRRERRLLLATLAVSVGMLLLLARFRFPENAARGVTEPAPAPLERLAARATYDELASIVADVERRILPTIAVLREQSEAGTLHIPGIRMSSDIAVAVLPRNSTLAPDETGVPPILARDPVRELVVVQVPARSAAVTLGASAARPGPRYVAVVEATARGVVVRPVYVGQTYRSTDPRWSGPVLSVAAVQQSLPRGAAVFSLEGAFIGLVADAAGTVLPAETLELLVAEAPAAPPAIADIGIDVQPLTPALARAAGTDAGVMVTNVAQQGGASPDLIPGDVIQSVDGIGVTTVAGFQQLAQSRTPGAAVALAVTRRGEQRTVTVKAVEATAPGTPAAVTELGAVLRVVPDVGAEVVTVQPGSVAARSGLQRGDLVLALDGVAKDTTSIPRAFRALPPGGALLLTIRRNAEHRVIAVEKP